MMINTPPQPMKQPFVKIRENHLPEANSSFEPYSLIYDVLLGHCLPKLEHKGYKSFTETVHFPELAFTFKLIIASIFCLAIWLLH